MNRRLPPLKDVSGHHGGEGATSPRLAAAETSVLLGGDDPSVELIRSHLTTFCRSDLSKCSSGLLGSDAPPAEIAVQAMQFDVILSGAAAQSCERHLAPSEEEVVARPELFLTALSYCPNIMDRSTFKAYVLRWAQLEVDTKGSVVGPAVRPTLIDQLTAGLISGQPNVAVITDTDEDGQLALAAQHLINGDEGAMQAAMKEMDLGAASAQARWLLLAGIANMVQFRVESRSRNNLSPDLPSQEWLAISEWVSLYMVLDGLTMCDEDYCLQASELTEDAILKTGEKTSWSSLKRWRDSRPQECDTKCSDTLREVLE